MDEKKLIVRMGATEIDVTNVEPIKQKDKRALARDYKVNLNRAADLSADDEAAIALHILRKFRPETTEAEVDDLRTQVVQDLIRHWVTVSAQVDENFSPRSTSSPASTAGASATSPA